MREPKLSAGVASETMAARQAQSGVRVLERPPHAIVLIGAGGTGGALLQPLCRLLYSLDDLAAQNHANPALAHDRDTGEAFDTTNDGAPPLMIVDGDTVQHYNIRRQMFVPDDVHQKKANILASRYSAAFGINVSSYPHYLSPEISADALRQIIPEESVVVGAVDNAATRRLLHDTLSTYSDVVYLDSGNAGIPHPENGRANELTGSRVNDRGYDGQVVCGARLEHSQVLPFPAEVFPDLIEIEHPEDRLPTEIPCGEAVVSQPQRLVVNIMAATVLLCYLSPILTEGVVPNSLTFFDARKTYQRPQKA